MKNDPAFSYEETVQVHVLSSQDVCMLLKGILCVILYVKAYKKEVRRGGKGHFFAKGCSTFEIDRE